MNNPERYFNDHVLLNAFMSSKDAIAVYYTPQLHIRFVNDAMLAIWGKDRSVIDKAFEDAIPEMDGQQFTGLLKRVWETGKSYISKDTPADFIINGKLITSYFDFEYKPLLDDEGKTYCILHTAVDVSERMKAWQIANDKEALAQQLIQDIGRANGELNRLNEKLNTANKDLNTLNEEYQSTNEELKALNEEYQATNEELNSLNEEYVVLNEELNATNEELNLSKSLLGRTEELMRFAVEAGGIGTWYIDIATREFIPSPKLKEFFGYKEDEVMPYEAALIQITDDYRDKVSAAVELAIARGETYDIEYPVISHSDNRVRWVKAMGKLYPDASGNLSHFSGVMIDITTEKIAQQTRQDSEQRFRSLAEGSEVMISVNDIDGNVEYVNRAWLDLTGRTQQEMKDYGWGDFLHPDDQEALLKEFRKGIASKGPFTVEFRMMNRNKQPRWIYTKINPRLSADGDYTGTISSSIDITDRRLIEQELQEVNTRLSIAIDAGSFGSTEVDVATGAMICNEQFRKCFGKTVDEEFTYPMMFEAMLPKYREEIRRKVQVAQKNRSVYEAEYEVTWPDGSVHWIGAHGSARYDINGEPVKWIGIISDITESKRDEQRKDDFIGMVSHELKTPLTSLTAIVQLAEKKLKGSADGFLAGAMVRAEVQVKKMASLINGFLNVSRLESGKIEIAKQSFDLDKLLKEAIKDMELTATTHIIHTNICDGVHVFADRDKVSSVVSNLLSNAIKYSPKGENIYVTCEMNEDTARISVKDEGMGIKPEDSKRLFERYYRVEANNKLNISGFGIGLYLSAEIIERHDGQIGVDSEFGAGSTFWFTLPLEKTN